MELDQFRNVDVVLDKVNDNIIQGQFVSEGDYNGRTMTVMVTDGGVIGPISGLQASLLWTNQANKLTDEHPFQLIDSGKSIFRIEFPNNMLTAGTVVANIRIWLGGKVMTTKPFKISVGAIAGRMSGVIQQQEFGLLTAVLADASNLKGFVINELERVSAGAYDTVSSVSELNQEYPNGAPGNANVVVLESDGVTGFQYTFTNGSWKKGAKVQENGIGANRINKTMLSDQVYKSDYFNLFNVNFNNTNSFGISMVFDRTILEQNGTINFRGILKENVDEGRLSEVSISFFGSDDNNLTNSANDITIGQTITFGSEYRNSDKEINISLSQNFSNKRYIKVILIYQFTVNYQEPINSISLTDLIVRLENDELVALKHGLWNPGSKSANIQANLTGKPALVSADDLKRYATIDQLANYDGNKIITVNNSQEFVQAIYTAELEASADKWVEIRMASGVYNLLPHVDLNVTEVSALYNRGIEVPRFTKIIGASGLRTVIILRVPDTASTEAKWTVSPLNMKNDAWLEDLLVIGKNTRYAIHDDGGSVGYFRYAKNCHFLHEGHTGVEFVNETAYGCGIFKGSYSYFENTVFEAFGMGGYFHDNPTFDIESNIVFKNCDFNGGNQYPDHDFAVRFHSVGSPSANVNVKLLGCRMNKNGVQVRKTNASGQFDDNQRQSMILSGSGNTLTDDISNLVNSATD